VRPIRSNGRRAVSRHCRHRTVMLRGSGVVPHPLRKSLPNSVKCSPGISWRSGPCGGTTCAAQRQQAFYRFLGSSSAIAASVIRFADRTASRSYSSKSSRLRLRVLKCSSQQTCLLGTQMPVSRIVQKDRHGSVCHTPAAWAIPECTARGTNGRCPHYSGPRPPLSPPPMPVRGRKPPLAHSGGFLICVRTLAHATPRSMR
jgi:hypothetical protein